MATVINKVDAATAPFVGQGNLIIFDSTFANSKTYENAKLSDFQNPVSLGQIVQDSTSWEGEDVSTEQILDEQGNLITAKVTAGTLSFSFDIASTSANMMKKFMAAADISSANIGSPSLPPIRALLGLVWTSPCSPAPSSSPTRKRSAPGSILRPRVPRTCPTATVCTVSTLLCLPSRLIPLP